MYSLFSDSYDQITEVCSKYVHTGSLSSLSEDGNIKRKTKLTKRFGYDDTQSDTETESESSPPRKRRYALKRMDAFGHDHQLHDDNTSFPPAPSICLQSSDLRSAGESRSLLTCSSPISERPTVHVPSTSHASFSSVIGEVHELNEAVTDSCHCKHQSHWAKEILRVVLRMESYLRDHTGNKGDVDDYKSDESITGQLRYANTSDELSVLFSEIREDQQKQKAMYKGLVQEVTGNRKKSIQRILLRVAPPKVWMLYSKNGQRGKLSALTLGLHGFIVGCLNFSKVRHCFLNTCICTCTIHAYFLFCMNCKCSHPSNS